MKYQPDYPGRFESELHGRAWLQDFFGWHNEHHHHSGLALFTPSDVFHGRVELVAAERQHALDAAYAAHPERFPHGPPRVLRPPTAVHINPLAADVLPVAARALDIEQTEGAERADAREARAPARLAPLRGADTPAFTT
jgi:hypothetical protein